MGLGGGRNLPMSVFGCGGSREMASSPAITRATSTMMRLGGVMSSMTGPPNLGKSRSNVRLSRARTVP